MRKGHEPLPSRRALSHDLLAGSASWLAVGIAAAGDGWLAAAGDGWLAAAGRAGLDMGGADLHSR
jgi:hypothetical protein